MQKAEADFAIARQSRRSKKPLLHDGVCFHCQQCSEKYLKGLLEELGLAVPRTHNLDELRRLLLPHHPVLRSLGRGAVFLTNFAVAARYPGENASLRQAKAAIRWATRIRTTARRLLGIAP